MAFVQKNLENDETLAPLSGTTLVGNQGQPGAAPVQPAPGQGTGTGFVNLRQYLDANKNQSGQVAGKLAESLSNEAKGISGDIEKTGKEFESTVAAKNPINNALIEEAKANPVGVDAEQEKADQFRKMATGTYAGPGSIEEYDPYFPLKGRVEEGQRKAGLVDTEAGQFELLQGLGGPSRTRGEASLDQYLLGASPENLGIVKTGASELAARRKALDDMIGQARGYVDKTRGQLGEASSRIKTEFLGDGGVVPTLGSEISSGYGSALDQAIARLKAAYYPDEYQRQLEDYSAWYNASPKIINGVPVAAPPSVPTVPSFDPGLGTYASADQYARERALESLLGQDLDILNNAQAGGAGTFDQMLSDLLAAAPGQFDPIPEKVTIAPPTAIDPGTIQPPTIPNIPPIEIPTFPINPVWRT